ncbi:MAG TPA: LmeA family phospholipid-binding protein [Oscillatoriales cyanobacterium M59_W2019_021]|nr:LmeA family phospholipid-binding protein [Oscillatoriales cyanobacterium M4454_W2019_049]HIK49756.1 LmeA family phospholipid-binding protein [Oscillatoriales cyanobacterium M59_W2019_021]
MQQPLQAGIRLVITEDDLDRGFSGNSQNRQWEIGNYTFLNPQIDFLGDDRLRVRVEIREGDDPQTTKLAIESGLTVREGRYIALVDPQIQVDEETVSPQLLDTIFGGFDRTIDLDRLTPAGAIVRILELNLTSDRLELAAFVRLEEMKEN